MNDEPMPGGRTAPSRAAMILAFVFPFCVAGILLPLRILLENPKDFPDGLPLLVPAAAWLVAGIVAVAAVALFCNAGRRRAFLERGAAIALAFGAAILVSDAILPLALDAPVGFRDREQVLIADTGRLVAETAVWVLACALALWRPRVVLSRVGLTFAGVFLVSAAGTLARDCAAAACVGSATRVSAAVTALFQESAALPRWAVSTPREAGTADTGPNVYHVVLDGFNGAYFDGAMQGAGLDGEDLPGFVLFPSTRSQYDSTEFSTPSFLTGSVYRGGSLGDWKSSYTTGGLFHDLRARRGVPARIYGDDGFQDWQGDVVAVRRETAMDGMRRASRSLNSLALVRAMPGLLHRPLFDVARFEIMSPRAGERRVMPFEMLLADEATNPPRGQYSYVHILVPHAPYTLDARCRVSGAATYLTQASCGMTLVARLVRRLRELDRYESSLVIVHADHGWFDERWPDLRVVDPTTGLAVVRPLVTRPAAAWDTDPLRREAYSNALLLVKPPGRATGPLVRDLRLVELVDIPNTIYQSLGLPSRSPEGVSLFSGVADPDRFARTHTGARHFDADGTRMVFAGRDFFEGSLIQHHWAPRVGWFDSVPVPFLWVESEAVRCGGLKRQGAAPLQNVAVRRPRPGTLQLSWSVAPGASVSNDAEVLFSEARPSVPIAVIGRVNAGKGRYEVGDVSDTTAYRVGVRACAGTCCASPIEVLSAAGVP
jgi:hypothetical protein